ncbi:hypothetical protein D3C72_2334720 [compost metagenome]
MLCPKLPKSASEGVTGIPSITYKGSLLAESEPIPLMLTLFLPPGIPEEEVTTTPAILPCIISSGPNTGLVLFSFGLKVPMELLISLLF